jgi:DNA-binding LytR/AlgR family response regulator
MITCLIVEDEPLAAEIMQEYIKQIPFLRLIGICSDAIFAIDIMQREKIDLLFLDIHLPGLKGLDFLRTLQQAPAVIVTTAYHEYALQGYELNVIDYLLKPIEFKRFIEAVNKVKSKGLRSSKSDTITINAEKRTIILRTDEILFIESQKEYIKIQTNSRAYLSKYALSKMEEELDTEHFLRVHRSFIINTKHLKAFNSNEMDVGGVIIPIGGNYKDAVEEKLRMLFHKHM